MIPQYWKKKKLIATKNILSFSECFTIGISHPDVKATQYKVISLSELKEAIKYYTESKGYLDEWLRKK